jgi:uncharacterized membrane protein
MTSAHTPPRVRLPVVVRHVLYNLRGGFLVRPLIIALFLGALGAGLAWIEQQAPSLTAAVPRPFFPARPDPQVAQLILGDIAEATMTVVSIVFAILLMTLTLASMQFSPRIILSFARDRVTQWTLGVFLGTFCYCMAALPSARSVPAPFVPVATVEGAMLLALACVGWLLFFIHHISLAIGVNQIVDKIAGETERMVDEMMPMPNLAGSLPLPPRDGPDVSSWDVVVHSERSGYIRYVDAPALVRKAKELRTKIEVLRRVGHFVPAGAPLLRLYKGGRVPAAERVACLATFDLGPARTLQQDVEFGILQIVDIALKAISPAVNDPSTAISCIDQLSRILIRCAARRQPDPVLYDPPAVVRVVLPWIGFPQLLESAISQIRLYAAADVAVSLRLLRALADVAASTADPEVQRLLVEHGRRIVKGCAAKVGEEEMGGLRSRLGALEGLAGHSQPLELQLGEVPRSR